MNVPYPMPYTNCTAAVWVITNVEAIVIRPATLVQASARLLEFSFGVNELRPAKIRPIMLPNDKEDNSSLLVAAAMLFC